MQVLFAEKIRDDPTAGLQGGRWEILAAPGSSNANARMRP